MRDLTDLDDDDLVERAVSAGEKLLIEKRRIDAMHKNRLAADVSAQRLNLDALEDDLAAITAHRVHYEIQLALTDEILRRSVVSVSPLAEWDNVTSERVLLEATSTARLNIAELLAMENDCAEVISWRKRKDARAPNQPLSQLLADMSTADLWQEATHSRETTDRQGEEMLAYVNSRTIRHTVRLRNVDDTEKLILLILQLADALGDRSHIVTEILKRAETDESTKRECLLEGGTDVMREWAREGRREAFILRSLSSAIDIRKRRYPYRHNNYGLRLGERRWWLRWQPVYKWSRRKQEALLPSLAHAKPPPYAKPPEGSAAHSDTGCDIDWGDRDGDDTDG